MESFYDFHTSTSLESSHKSQVTESRQCLFADSFAFLKINTKQQQNKHKMYKSYIPNWTSVLLFAYLVTTLQQLVFAFPDGAPGETCTKHRPNHGATSQPLRTLPFLVQASASNYEPGETVAG